MVAGFAGGIPYMIPGDQLGKTQGHFKQVIVFLFWIIMRYIYAPGAGTSKMVGNIVPLNSASKE